MWRQGLPAIFIDTKSKSPRAKIACHLFPIFTPVVSRKPGSHTRWPVWVCVSLCSCACGWFVLSFFIFYELAVGKKRWDKSRENFHSAGIKSGFYSKLAGMTAANCSALSFQEQKHLLLQWMLLSISVLDSFSSVIHKLLFLCCE